MNSIAKQKNGAGVTTTTTTIQMKYRVMMIVLLVIRELLIIATLIILTNHHHRHHYHLQIQMRMSIIMGRRNIFVICSGVLFYHWIMTMSKGGICRLRGSVCLNYCII